MPTLTASKEAVDSLLEDVEYLWANDKDNIPVYDAPPTALHFLREHVAKSRPCLIRRALPPMTWRDLQDIWPESLPLHVDVTPDGHGDCLRQVVMHQEHTETKGGTANERCFVKPMEYEMSMSEFCQALEESRQTSDSKGKSIHERVFERASSNDAQSIQPLPPPLPPFENAVVYYSRQNDCLRTELKPLWDKLPFPASLDWAAEAFGVDGPDAVNLWIGPDQAVSAMHKDPYENLFHVLQGTKVFTLVPPACAPLLRERPVPSARFVWSSSNNNNNDWQVQPDVTAEGTPDTVPWITVDVTQQQQQQTPQENDTPIPFRQVRVQAGEMLYLPSLWFHKVAQEGDVTVGLNYWYDMKFESPLWVYFHFLQQMQVVADENA